MAGTDGTVHTYASMDVEEYESLSVPRADLCRTFVVCIVVCANTSFLPCKQVAFRGFFLVYYQFIIWMDTMMG